MKQESINTLEQYRPKLRVWQNDKTCHLTGSEKDQILRVIREEFNPNYQVDLWCGHCVVKMLEYAFAEMDARLVKFKISVHESDTATSNGAGRNDIRDASGDAGQALGNGEQGTANGEDENSAGKPAEGTGSTEGVEKPANPPASGNSTQRGNTPNGRNRGKGGHRRKG